MRNIRVGDGKIIIGHQLEHSSQAALYADGTIEATLIGSYHRDPESHWRKANPDAKLGVEFISGACTIEISVADLLRLCVRSARNKNRRAVQGPGVG